MKKFVLFRSERVNDRTQCPTRDYTYYYVLGLLVAIIERSATGRLER